MTGLFALGLRMEEGHRADGAVLLRCSVPLPGGLPEIMDRLRHWVDTAPGRTLLTEAEATRAIGYAEALAAAEALAGQLRYGLGLSPGATVASLVPAGIDALVLRLACLVAGLVHVTLPPQPFAAGADTPSARAVLSIARPAALFLPAGHPAAGHPAALLLAPMVALARGGDLPSLPPAAAAPRDLTALFFTSGSTGTAKAVRITRGMIASCQGAVAAMWPFLAATPPVLVDWLPWHHVFGGLDNLFKIIWHGGTLHVDRPPAAGDPGATLRLMATVRPTLHIAVPLALRHLLAAAAADPSATARATERLDALFFAGAGIDAALWDGLRALRDRAGRFGILSGYGATEAASTICLSPAPLERPGELGCPLPGHEVALVTAEGRAEVCVSGPNLAPGYLTAAGPAPLDRDSAGFWRTGDAAVLRTRADGRRVLAFDGRIAEDFKLQSGVRVRAGALRAALLAACSPHLTDIVVEGENRPDLVALVFPPGLAQATHAAVSEALGRWNAANPGSSTAIVRFGVAAEAPDRGRGELSDKGQIVQSRFLRNHAGAFAALRADGGTVPGDVPARDKPSRPAPPTDAAPQTHPRPETDRMHEDPLLYVKDADDAFVTITLNRPEKMNAIDAALGDAIEAAIRRAEADPGVRAVILTGAGRAFSAGFDLQGEDFEMDAEGWRRDIGANMRRFRAIWEAEIPVIAAVNGWALAGGLELMLCCDLAIAAESARFGEPEVRHVSAPPTLMLPWTVPMRHARWLMYTGDTIDAAEALRIHLVNRVVPDDRLRAEAERVARKCARMPGAAIKFAKAALNHMQETAGLPSSWTYNRETTAMLHASEEGRRWMGLLKGRSLREFLDIRERPFRDLD
ncbi:MAG: AMP-binding protein [Rhodobacteraceae bacterium]|jgi:feruloyl-CoA synthase|nr:AMP-binding protein [Paracoccaceae bacterium]